jgi:hypothetical protein
VLLIVAPAERHTLRDLGRSVWTPEAERTGRGRRNFSRDLSLFGWILVGAALIARAALRGGRLSWQPRRAMRSRVVDRDGLFIAHARRMGRGDGTW